LEKAEKTKHFENDPFSKKTLCGKCANTENVVSMMPFWPFFQTSVIAARAKKIVKKSVFFFFKKMQ